ncbi:MAG: SRPBCC family protein [Candidatus Heimdallarchaeota archaeon]|nr:SRPBCC family protein [Candidatus Heimdallarchaeota archaeon]MDH5647924.1 SRPBCC family protein [Candidatus Heimdallarchaeota archaeon]
MAHIFSWTTLINSDIFSVFEFFSKPENLEVITPPFLKFRIMSKLPIQMKLNTEIDYQLKLRKIPVKWKTLITEWDPPNSFQDKQLRGPYKLWIHTHKFEESSEGIKIFDNVEYEVPGWIFRGIIHKFVVLPDLKRIFTYREKIIKELLDNN